MDRHGRRIADFEIRTSVTGSNSVDGVKSAVPLRRLKLNVDSAGRLEPRAFVALQSGLWKDRQGHNTYKIVTGNRTDSNWWWSSRASFSFLAGKDEIFFISSSQKSVIASGDQHAS